MTVCQIEFVADFFVHSKTQIGTRSQLPIMKNKKYKKSVRLNILRIFINTDIRYSDYRIPYSAGPDTVPDIRCITNFNDSVNLLNTGTQFFVLKSLFSILRLLSYYLSPHTGSHCQTFRFRIRKPLL